MNKRGKITVSFLIFIVLVLAIFVLQTKEVITQSSPEISQPAQGRVGSGGATRFPEQAQKPEVPPKEVVPINLSNKTVDLSLQIFEEGPSPNLTLSSAYIDSRIEEELNKTTEVPVIVKIKDISRIKVTSKDSLELQELKDRTKKEILENKTNSVLSTLPGTEFRLSGKFLLGNGFYGHVTKQGFDKLVNNSDIELIVLDRSLKIGLDKSRPLINADDVETAGYTGLHQTACVLDTGIDYDISALGGCFGATCKVRGGWDYVNNDGNPDDDNGHGTHVAGIIASTDSNIRGIAPNAKLVAMKVCNASGDCFGSYIVSALQYCYNNRNIYNISAVSISIGDGGDMNG